MSDAFHSEEAEVDVIAAMVDSAEARAKACAILEPDDFYFADTRVMYSVLADMHARGVEVDPVTVTEEVKGRGKSTEVGGMDGVLSFWSHMPLAGVEEHAMIVKRKACARDLNNYCRKTIRYLEEGGYTDGGKKIADRLSSRVLSIYSRDGVAAQEDRSEMLDRLWEVAQSGQTTGVNMPWAKLNEWIGPLVPGEVVGLSGYSGQGKSTFAANLFRGLCKAGHPCIYFPTEMQDQLMQRVAAAESLTSQRKAEKNTWDPGSHDLGRFQAALMRMKDWPFEIVNASNVKVREVINRTRALRRRWPGKAPVVFVDHMHRLDYGSSEANRKVGDATRVIKNFAGYEGLIFFLLYQPRKPEDIDALNRPVRAHQVRGDSQVWNELDVHMSPFRSYVKCSPSERNELGNASTVKGSDGTPIMRDDASEPNTKLDDEHIYLKIDKRRIGGAGPTLFFPFHALSGRISERPVSEDHGRQLDVA